jgi:hypothetical protein
MMRKAILISSLLTLSATVQAGTSLNKISANGTSLNKISANGTSLNSAAAKGVEAFGMTVIAVDLPVGR